MTASTHLRDIVDVARLADLIEAGYIRRQVHPDLPLAICNYTEKSVYERVWVPETRQCRGLVYNTSTGEVVARPLPKFWNYGEAEAGELPLHERAVVFDKADGSLAIVYPTTDGLAVATRGSFTSEQAIHATTVLRTRYAEWSPPAGLTVLAEIIYPANRIVVDYQGLDDLILLGAVEIATGRTFGPDAVPDWPGPVVETFPYRSLPEALAAPVRDNREGFVIWFPNTDTRTKLKYEAYVQLHRIVTGLNARVVWEQLGEGRSVADICEPLPDELHDWVKSIAADLSQRMVSIIVAARQEHARIKASLPAGWTRKDYAAVAGRSPNRAWLFLLLDGKDPSPKIWRTLRPSGEDRPLNITEDVA